MGLIIKKRVSLEFLGEEYKDSYLIVRAIGVGEYDNLKGTVRDEVINRFVDGEIVQDGKLMPVTLDNIKDLPGEVFVEAYSSMIGTLPKELMQSVSS